MCFHVGCPIVCREEGGEALGGRGGVSVGLYGETGESRPHGGLQRVYRQVCLLWSSINLNQSGWIQRLLLWKYFNCTPVLALSRCWQNYCPKFRLSLRSICSIRGDCLKMDFSVQNGYSLSKEMAHLSDEMSVSLPLPDRVILALVERHEDRGLVVAQGGGKVSIFSPHANWATFRTIILIYCTGKRFVSFIWAKIQ